MLKFAVFKTTPRGTQMVYFGDSEYEAQEVYNKGHFVDTATLFSGTPGSGMKPLVLARHDPSCGYLSYNEMILKTQASMTLQNLC